MNASNRSKARITVDTSVWIEYFRNTDPHPLTALIESDRVLMPIPSYVELLTGMRADRSQKITRLIKYVPMGPAVELVWNQAATWAEEGARTGERFGVADLLIAAIANNEQLPLWSLDQDFARMEGLGWITRYDRSIDIL